MKKIFTLLSAGLGSICLFAQQDPQFSQYMFNKLFMNPGYAGTQHAMCYTLIARNQWSGFDGTPKSAVFSADGYIPEIYGGAGVNVMYDQQGFERNLRYNADYSFHIKTAGNGTLGIGLEVGGYSKRIGPTGNDQWVATTNWTSDNAIPPMLKKTNVDLGAGIWYSGRNVWGGISTTHLTAEQMNGVSSNGNSLGYQVARHYFITGGVKLQASGAWEIDPSFLVKSDATITSFDVNMLATFEQRFWGGISYRYKDAICPMVGFQFKNYEEQIVKSDSVNVVTKKEKGTFKAGFAYDYNTSGLHPYNNGTFELFVNYCMPVDRKWKRVGHGDTRIFDPPGR